MPPKKAKASATAAPALPKAETKAKVAKKAVPAMKVDKVAKPAKAVRLTKAQANKAKVEAKLAEQSGVKPATKSTTKPASAKSAKRKAAELEEEEADDDEDEDEDEEDDEDEDEDKASAPVAKKAKISATKSAPAKAPMKKKVAPAPKKPAPKKPAAKKPAPKVEKKPAATKKAAVVEPESEEDDPEQDDGEDDEEDEEEEEDTEPAVTPVPKKATAPKKDPAPKKVAESKKAPAPRKIAAPKRAKALPDINESPKQILDVFVFGEGSQGELGLGSKRGPDGKAVIDVSRPRLNYKLLAKDVGVVALAVGGMHCLALTKDNKILSWGVNDQGALGRITKAGGKMKSVDPSQEDNEQSDDDDDDDSGLNPNESTPLEVDTTNIEEGTKFASIYAGDSCSFAVTTAGLVYGWGSYRANDGILGFTEEIETQEIPALMPDLKNITTLAVGNNHVISLDNKGKTKIWGAGEQGQLARRVVARTARGATKPREFGLQRSKIVVIGAGDYHSFAVDNKGMVYAWGLNTFGQTGIPKADAGDDTVSAATKVPSLSKYDYKQIVGGAHHTLAVTNDGKVIVWGRLDANQGGIEMDKIDRDSVYVDENGRPRYYTKPVQIPDIKGVYVATANDSCIAVDKEGKAYSWGFSVSYQTGQGTSDDIEKATLLENAAVRGKKLVFAGVGGQFGVLAGDANVVMANGV